MAALNGNAMRSDDGIIADIRLVFQRPAAGDPVGKV